MSTHPSSVEHNGSRSYQTLVAYSASMHDCTVGDRNSIPHDARVFRGTMKNHIVLQTAVCPYPDPSIVPTYNGAGPNAGVRSNRDTTNYDCRRGKHDRGMQLWLLGT